jgi:hypothetical protein
MKMPRMVEGATLHRPGADPDDYANPGIVVSVRLDYWEGRPEPYELSVTETAGERRRMSQRYRTPEEASGALGAVYAAEKSNGTWRVTRPARTPPPGWESPRETYHPRPG